MEGNKRIAITALAIALAAPAEGLRRYAYYDPPGILTVCFGHTGSDIVKNKQYSLEECKNLLTTDMLLAVDMVGVCAPGLPVKSHAAFADAAFNLGGKVICDQDYSTLARKLAKRDLLGACEQLPRWNKGRIAGVLVELPGLTTRRLKEQTLCLEGYYELGETDSVWNHSTVASLAGGFG